MNVDFAAVIARLQTQTTSLVTGLPLPVIALPVVALARCTLFGRDLVKTRACWQRRHAPSGPSRALAAKPVGRGAPRRRLIGQSLRLPVSLH